MLYEFIVKLPSNQLDQSIEALNIAGLYNLYYEPSIEIKKVKNGYDYEELTKDYMELRIYAEEREVENLPDSYLSRIQDVLHIPKEEINIKQIDDSSWTQSFEDIDLGNGWVLCYSGDEAQYASKQVLKFEPQAAFGTGLHETTQDCLRIILKTDLTDQSVLDLGTGSGVLTIAAAMKQAKRLVAVDYEPVEREIQHNAKLNGITTPIDIEQADLLHGEFVVNRAYDWIIINIGADETVQILSRHQLLQKSSNFLISGLVDWNTEQVRRMFIDAGFEVEKQLQSNEWVTYHFRK
ncbi:50S ribosomal protein L11 methyltransferase [Aquibacillus sediminis]|uniref:50S ribosomal protein L11 methyltransferase n=1 Tax=Aquibacillus sediminis TaxID=2574734 RepID=UPI001108FD62|nr:50S ribosomal protein L11 methyltransferase [Aquibacillus sediminis]